MSTNAIALTDLLIAERPALVRWVARIVGSEPAAEDVAQALYLRVQQINDDPPILNKRSFLFRLARNLAVDQSRVERRDRGLFDAEALSDDVADDRPLAERQLLDREALALVQSAVADLSPRCRQILHMRRMEGMPTREIALRLGISRQMVTRYLAQAMEHFLERLNGDG